MAITLDGTTGVTAAEFDGTVDASNLTGTLPAIDGSALTGIASGGVTLLGTLATTSGTSVTLSSLDLSEYKQLSVVCNAVSGDTAATTQVMLNGYAMFRVNTSTTTDVGWGVGTIDLTTGIFGASSNYGTTVNGAALGGLSTLTTASTSITFTISFGNFDAGSISVYGVA